MKVLMYQPDIAGNVGTIARLCACMDIELNIIEPCGFLFEDKKFKRAGMDYLDFVKINRFLSFEKFREQNKDCRIVLLTTKGDKKINDFQFNSSDVLMVGRESAGVPETIHNTVNERVVIPMKNNSRSINVAISLSMALAIAMQQCGLF